ncbi:hypothetical protein [Lactobacillus sp.]|uniref:hypothetical protein n=1 Tax=Lactobacillus sp. TaxID=1591 RepID=UPI003F0A07E0
MTSQNNSPVSRIEAGESWQIKDENAILTITSKAIKFTDLKDDSNFIIPCDTADLANFCLTSVSNLYVAEPLLEFGYEEGPGIPANEPLFFPYDPELTGEVVQIVNYLTQKIASKSVYDGRQKDLAAKREYERLYGAFRYTRGQAEHFDDNHYRMRYFQTIELRGSKCTPEWYLLQPEMEVNFVDDGDNVLIACQGQILGYLPNPRIANLVKAAIANREQKTFAFIKAIDEKRQVIQLGLAIYQKMTEPVLANLPHIESWLLETDGEDIVGESRQKHLEQAEVGQLLSLQLNPPYEQITVCTLEGDELGKLNKQDTALAMRCNKKLQIFSEICQMDYQHHIRCRVRILFIDPKTQEN